MIYKTEDDNLREKFNKLNLYQSSFFFSYEDVLQDMLDQTVLFRVLIPAMETDAMKSVSVTRTAVTSLQDVDI